MTITIERVREHLADLAIDNPWAKPLTSREIDEIAALAISENERAEKAQAEVQALRDQLAASHSALRLARDHLIEYHHVGDTPDAIEAIDALLAKETK